MSSLKIKPSLQPEITRLSEALIDCKCDENSFFRLPIKFSPISIVYHETEIGWGNYFSTGTAARLKRLILRRRLSGNENWR